MIGMNKNIVLYLLLLVLGGCNQDMGESGAELSSAFDFEGGSQGWEGGTSDFPADFLNSGADFSFSASKVPNSIISESSGLKINADNPHGDLFYFFKRKVDGLNPLTTYQLDFEFLMYTQVVTELSALSSKEIYLKIGAVNHVPMLESITSSDSIEYMVLNVDKGDSNSDSGEDLVNIGSIREFTGNIPEVISGNTFGHQIQVAANDNGEIWLVVGVDSGLKGQLTFGIDAITVFYTKVD